MSIIAIKGIPFRHSIPVCVTMFKKKIGGQFEALNFSPYGTGKATKTLYIRLSEKLDPVQVVTRLNTNSYKGMVAFIPEHVPDLPLSTKGASKPMKKKGKFIPHAFDQPKVALEAHYQLFNEIQYKFPGLFNLSLKTKHKLLDELAVIISDRLIKVMSSQGKEMNCFEATSMYRKSHPHFGDFQLILTTLHRLQDAAGAPRLQISEQELATMPDLAFVEDKIPRGKIQSAYNQYVNKVTAAVTQHIKALECKAQPGDDEQTVARKKVREELKKMLPYLSVAMMQIAEHHFLPPEEPHRRIRIYGEPFLPNRDAMSPFTRKFLARNTVVTRVQNMYNVIRLKVEQDNYAAIRAMDGTVVNGAKLVIRDSDIPIRKPQDALRKSLAAHFGGVPHRFNDDEEDDDDPAAPMSEDEDYME